jgi:hypothetical protein
VGINNADVAELVDARDLKCPATPESSHLFWKIRSHFWHQPVGKKRDLENIFGGPRMALTVETLLALGGVKLLVRSHFLASRRLAARP